jgi:hypothetical protein
MLERHVLIPILFVCVFAAPIIYHQKNKQPSPDELLESRSESSYGPENFGQPSGNFFLPSQKSGASPSSVTSPPASIFRGDESAKLTQAPQAAEFSGTASNRNFILASQTNPVPGNLANVGYPPGVPPAYQGGPNDWQGGEGLNSGSYSNSFGNQQMGSVPYPFGTPASPQPLGPVTSQAIPQWQSSPIPAMPAGFTMGGTGQWVPDYGKAETLYLPGNQFGPDFSAVPLENLPVWDFNEILNFEITPEWVRRRWKRVSTTPTDVQFSGMRIPLVTGTNTWDLQGSLTYYFDKNQRLQRITFRGWTGDPQKLVQVLTGKFQLKPQPTTLAGFYLHQYRRTPVSGMMMKYPQILDSSLPNQQLGVIMELNRPGGSEMSQDFRDLILGSHPDL